MGLSGWDSSKKLKLTIDSSKVDENLTNFPVNITLSSGTGQTGFDATAVFDELLTVSGTKKIAITTTVSGIETELYTEIERWDWVEQEANLWTKVPTVSSGTDTELSLYYDSDHVDNTTYIGDTGDIAARNVWDSNFKLVMHMAQDPSGGSGAMKDSTSNVNNGTPGGGMTTADLVNGKIGEAIDFDGNNDYFTCPIGTAIGTGDYTIEFLYRIVSSALLRAVSPYTMMQAGTDTKFPLLLCDLNNTRWTIQRSTAGRYFFTHTTDDDWHDLAIKRDGGVVFAYRDGESKTLSTDGTDYDQNGVNFSDTSFFLNRFYYNSTNYYTAGTEDEIRLSDIARSAAWIKATYYSNWDDFVTFGEVVEFVFMNPIPAHLSTAYGTTKQLYLTTTISGPAPEYVYDADFFDNFDVQIGTTVSGINSGSQAVSNVYLSTPSGIDYSWYMTASSSGVEDTSQTYTFHNRFLASGTTEVNGVLTSGIGVRLYLRDTGELLGSTISTISGTFNIETQYNAEFYCVALSPYTDTNSLIYDFLEPD